LQHYKTDESLWPINKPIPKIEGQSQCSGEAEYVADISPAKGELAAAFVISDVANCDLDTVDPSEALVILSQSQ
jgi:xanthine dehydrogenase/oxidase